MSWIFDRTPLRGFGSKGSCTTSRLPTSWLKRWKIGSAASSFIPARPFKASWDENNVYLLNKFKNLLRQTWVMKRYRKVDNWINFLCNKYPCKCQLQDPHWPLLPQVARSSWAKYPWERRWKGYSTDLGQKVQKTVTKCKYVKKC